MIRLRYDNSTTYDSQQQIVTRHRRAFDVGTDFSGGGTIVSVMLSVTLDLVYLALYASTRDGEATQPRQDDRQSACSGYCQRPPQDVVVTSCFFPVGFVLWNARYREGTLERAF